MNDHPWTNSYTEFQVHTLPLIKQYGKEIGEKSKEGNKVCKRIISNYELLYKSFDAMTHELLKIDLCQYAEDRKENGDLKL